MIPKKILTQVVFCFLTCVAFGQLTEPQPVNMSDFGVTDEEASAVFLVNNGHTEVRYDRRLGTWVASTERIYRIKILKKDALELGDVKIQLYLGGKVSEKRENLDGIKAVTYNFNPETSRIESSTLSKKDIYKVDVSEKLREVSFTLPNVKVNSVIEIAYTKHSPFIDQLDDWEFQLDYPVRYSHFAVTIPAFYVYVFQLQGYLEAKASNMQLDEVRKPFGRYTYQDLKAFWEMEDIPAFRNEPFMTTRDDYLSKLVFQLQTLRTPDYEKNFLKTWEAVTSDLQNSRLFKLFYTGKKDFTAFTPSTAADPLERAKEIYKDFKKTFSWNNYYGVYPDISFRKMMEKKTGNSSSMGLTLFQILEQSGLDARPVLFSPRSNGGIAYNYPFRDKLIATVVRLKIDGKTYLLDPMTNVPFGYLNGEFLNGKGLVLGDQVEWEDLTKVAQDYKSSEIKLNVSADSITADLSLTMKDYGLISSGDDLEGLFKPDWELRDLTLVENELTMKKVTARIAYEIEDDLILIPLSFDELIFAENPLKSEKRRYPVDFYYSKRYSHQLKIELSDEYAFESLPENRLIRLPDRKLDMSVNTSQLGNTANITIIFWTRTNSFDVRSYPKLREAYELMGELSNTSILVRKKK